MKTIEVVDLDDPLPEIERALKREFPGERIRTVGLGRRRRGAAADPETVLVVVLTKKLDRLPRGRRRMPKHVDVAGRWLGSGVTVRLPVRVEGVPSAVPTSHIIGPVAGGTATLGCYAHWPSGNQRQFGCLTTGHAMWRSPGDDRPRRTAKVKLPPGSPTDALVTTVVAASHLKRDGVDVALLRFRRTPDGRPPVGLRRVVAGAVAVPTPRTLIDRLGNATDAADVEATFKRPLLRTPPFESVAYYDHYPVKVGHGWGTVTLKGAVESKGTQRTFVGGTSGAGIVSKGAGRLGLGLQSLCLDPGTDTHSLATPLHAALAWLSERHGLDVTPVWNANA